jgi:hypothetical protein
MMAPPKFEASVIGRGPMLLQVSGGLMAGRLDAAMAARRIALACAMALRRAPAGTPNWSPSLLAKNSDRSMRC